MTHPSAKSEPSNFSSNAATTADSITSTTAAAAIPTTSSSMTSASSHHNNDMVHDSINQYGPNAAANNDISDGAGAGVDVKVNANAADDSNMIHTHTTQQTNRYNKRAMNPTATRREKTSFLVPSRDDDATRSMATAAAEEEKTASSFPSSHNSSFSSQQQYHHAHSHPTGTPISPTKIRLYFSPIFILLNSLCCIWSIRNLYHLLHTAHYGYLLVWFNMTHVALQFGTLLLCIWELTLTRTAILDAKILRNPYGLFPLSFLLGLYLLLSSWLWNSISWKCSHQFHAIFCHFVTFLVSSWHSALLFAALLCIIWCLFICCDVVLFGNDSEWENFLFVCKLVGGWRLYRKGKEMGVRRGWIGRNQLTEMLPEMAMESSPYASSRHSHRYSPLFSSAVDEDEDDDARRYIGRGGLARKRMLR